MSFRTIIKANDGRGLGHILRVLNFVDYKHFADTLKLIVHKGFADQVPERIVTSLVTDERWRVNLDFLPGKNIYYKAGNDNHNKNGGGTIDEKVRQALKNYYFSVLDNLGPDIQLVYIDDQNSPETVFTEKIAKAIGVKNPGSMRQHAKNAKIAFEIETQVWDFIGNYGMGTTRQECFSNVDYIHLSSDVDFFRSVIGNYPFGEYAQKIIPMGFPVSSEKMERFKQLRASPIERETLRQRIFTLTGEEKKNICYSTFGAGEGAEQVVDALLECVDQRQDCAFVANDPKGGLLEKMRKVRTKNADGVEIAKYEIVEKAGFAPRVIGKGGNALIMLTKNTLKEHLDYLASSDVLIQGAGSGTTYEGIACGVPLISLPLNRPGYEQIIKSMGIEIFGAGHALYIDDVFEQVGDFYALTESYGHSVRDVGKKCTPKNLLESIEDMLRHRAQYEQASASMNGFFAMPYDTMRTLDDMAAHQDVSTIIRKNHLKPF